jgi:hypothetical protein
MVLSMWPCKKQMHSQVLIVLFNPTHKIETLTTNKWETINAIDVNFVL